MSKFYKGVNHNELKVGKIYRTAIPFTVSQPLKFFESCTECKDKQNCNTVKEGCGKALENPNG